MFTALKLLATAGLGAGYLFVAFLAAHPHVDTEYTAHFVHRTADCWVPQALRRGDAAQPAVVELGPTGYPEACQYLRMGWFELEDWGVWSFGTKATLELPRRPGAHAVELTFRAAPVPNPTIRVSFVLNGQTMQSEVDPGTTKTITIPLPPEGEPYDPDMQITCQDTATIPNLPPRPDRYPKGGTRKVGLGLVAIRYIAAEPEAGGGRL